MNPSQTEAAAALLLEARRSRQRIDALPRGNRPEDLEQAYAIQIVSLPAILRDAGGGESVGYKVGCTSQTAQDQLGVFEPFSGRLLSPFVHRSPAQLPAESFFMRILEPEIAFRLGSDLPDQAAPWHEDSVRPAIATVMGAIEIVDSRYTDWTTIGAPHLVADNACAGHWVHGPESSDIEAVDYAHHAVSISVNGAVRERGIAGNALGSPLRVLAWLANHLAQRGEHLCAGALVTTGTTTVVVPAEPGDHAVADFGALGTVRVSFD